MAKAIQFNCKVCGGTINIPVPSAQGIYTVTCPHCQGKQKIKYTPKPVQLASQPDAAKGVACPQCGTNNPADVVFCRMCGRRLAQSVSSSVSAPASYGRPATEVFDFSKGATSRPAAPVPQTSVADFGALTLVRIGEDKKRFPLKTGVNVVGRADDLQPSDIQITGDDTISRKSIQIEMPSRKLTVLKSTNPVRVSGKQLVAGQSVILQFSDTIILGSTMLRYEK